MLILIFIHPTDITENLDLLVEKMSLDRFSDSDDDEEEDDDDEFSSPTLKPSTKKQDIVPSTFPSPSKIPKSEENTTSSRLPPSVATTNNVPRDLRKASFYSAEILGECYEWMWHVGFKGIDPLSLPSTNDSKKSQNSTTPTPTTTTGEYFPRVDIPYSLIWINEHIKRLEYILCQIKYLLATFYEEITLNKSFRASKFKKEMEYQAVPINLHIQNLVLQKCSSEMNSMKKSDDPTAVHIVDSVTCGAMACHGLGYSQGGLHNIETGLQRTKANLENFKKQYMNDTSTIQMNKLSKSGEEITFNSKSREYEFREFLATSLFNYENSTTNIILRRIYSLSQIISIALNSFLYKLELVIEGHIPSYFLERWYSFGFLILFECLLSVNGKERAMLEDTRTAIDMIQLYHIRVLPSPNPLINNPNSSHEWYRDQNINEQKRFQWLEGIRGDCADTHIIGREILLFIPENSITSLPEPIRSIIMTTGAIFNIKAALFSQGIDIMQSMTNAWDSHESGLSSRDLQYQINLQGLQQLNTYCELVQPVRTTLSLSTSPSSCPSNSVKLVDSLSSSPPLSQPTPTTGHLYSGLTQEAHPLIEVLSNIIYTTNINEKNVEMLIEVERIGRILGACRVTFCKSGKDRTGMAITLEQSRLLGENFDCGQSFERIIRDANTMRQYGTRLMVAEKNIGRAIYAINRLQIKFLPLYYRPPIQLTEDIIKKSDNS